MATASKTGSARPVTTAIMLAAGGDEGSRELLHSELSDSTVAALAVQNLRQVLPPRKSLLSSLPKTRRFAKPWAQISPMWSKRNHWEQAMLSRLHAGSFLTTQSNCS